MATVLECLTIPRATISPYLPTSPSSYPSVSLKLPVFKSVKVSATSPARSSVVAPPSRRCFRVACKSSETALGVPALTKDSWKPLVLESDKPVLVEFWAPWCGPCRIIQPAIDELAKEYAGKLKVFKVNTDECPEIASDYGVRSIPTVIIFSEGQKRETIIGAVQKPTLISNVEKFL